MDSKRWDEVQKLFEKALEINTSERESFLKSECGDDEELFDEVTSLLSADEKQHALGDGRLHLHGVRRPRRETE